MKMQAKQENLTLGSGILAAQGAAAAKKEFENSAHVSKSTSPNEPGTFFAFAPPYVIGTIEASTAQRCMSTVNDLLNSWAVRVQQQAFDRVPYTPVQFTDLPGLLMRYIAVDVVSDLWVPLDEAGRLIYAGAFR